MVSLDRHFEKLSPAGNTFLPCEVRNWSHQARLQFLRVLYNPFRNATPHIVSEMRTIRKTDTKIALMFTSERSCVRARIDWQNKNVHLGMGPHEHTLI